jgi:7-cyano-7-deazaguanine synthase
MDMSQSPPDAILLLSGGADSALLLHEMRDEIHLAVFVDYGQPAAEMEHGSAMILTEKYGIPLERVVFPMELGQMGVGGAEVVPVRNAMLVVVAANIAAGSPKCTRVIYGAQHQDRTDYADCTEEYVRHLNAVTSPFGIRVEAPHLRLKRTKVEIMEALRAEGIDRLTWSCYRGGDVPCGECNACKAITLAVTAQVGSAVVAHGNRLYVIDEFKEGGVILESLDPDCPPELRRIFSASGNYALALGFPPERLKFGAG